MKRLMKKMTSLLLATCACLSLLPTPAAAAGDHFTESDLNGVRSTMIQSAEYASYVNKMMKYHILSETRDYRVERNLKQGKSVVFFFEGCSDNVRSASFSDTSKYRRSAYCAVVQLVNGKPTIVYECEDCTTLPDNPRRHELNLPRQAAVPTVVDGVYNIKVHNHKTKTSHYAALKILGDGGTTPVIRCKRDSTDLSDSSTGINIHARSWETISTSTYSSVGCFNVGLGKAGDNYAKYNEFIRVVTGKSNARNSLHSAEALADDKKDVGVVIVDRLNYQAQLKEIFSRDCTLSDTAVNAEVEKIVEYTKGLDAGDFTPSDPDPVVLHVIDSTYAAFTPFRAYALSTGKVQLYNVYGTPYSLSSRYINGATDQCIIEEVYKDGWCKVTYPSSASSTGFNTEYTYLSNFVASPSASRWTADKGYEVYRRSDMGTKFGSISAGDKCLTVSSSGSNRQVIYPVSGAGYFKMGWMSTAVVEEPKAPTNSDFPTPMIAYNHSADTNTIVYQYESTIGGAEYGKIFPSDRCTVNAVNLNKNWVYVTYPTSAGDKNGFVYLNQFFPSMANISAVTKAYIATGAKVYRKADMAAEIGSVDPGDEITIVGRGGNNLLQVFYPVTKGADIGKYKLGWIYGDALIKNLTKIAVTSKPAKTIYLEGENFASNGMVVTAYYDDGSSAVVSNYSVKGYSSTPGAKTVEIVYSESGKTYTAALDITVQSKSPVKMEVIAKPNKVIYYMGEMFDPTGMAVKVTYDNGETALVTDYYFMNDILAGMGENTVIFGYTYNRKTVTAVVTVDVIEAVISELTLTSLPSKLTYTVGECVELAGLILTATYSDGTADTITEGFTCYPEVLSEVGTQEVTVAYNGFSVAFDVSVGERTSPEYAGTLSFDTVSGTVGSTVEVPLRISENPGVIATRLSVSYDADTLTLVGVEDGGILGEYTFGKELSANPYVLMWENGLATEDYTASGILATLTFRIHDDAVAGTAAVSLNYDPDEIYNVDLDNVGFSKIAGGVTITEKPQPVLPESVTITPTDIALAAGNSAQLIASVLPLNVDEATITWSSSDPAIALVSEAGLVSALKPGTATIKATAHNGVYAECSVVVSEPVNGTFNIGSAKILKGETVKIPVSIMDNPGIAGFTLSVEYPEVALEPVSIEAGEALSAGALSSNIQNADRTSLRVTWYSDEDATDNGEAFVLTFRAKEDASGNHEVTLKYDASDICNAEGENVPFVTVAGNIQVADYLLGDIYQDGEVNMKDIILFARYFNEMAALNESQKKAANLNSDMAINVKDLVLLAKTLVSGSKKPQDSAHVGQVSMLAVNDDMFAINVGSASIASEESVVLNVTAQNCPGVAAYRFAVNYDDTVFEVESVLPGEAVAGKGVFSSNLNEHLTEKKPLIVTWYAMEDVDLLGALFSITLKPRAGVISGNYEVSVLPVSEHDISNADFEDVSVELSSGIIWIRPVLAVTEVLKETTNTGIELTIQVESGASEDVRGLLVSALYQDGRMCQSSVKEIPLNNSTVVDVITTEFKAANIRVYILDPVTYTPLVSAYEVS